MQRSYYAKPTKKPLSKYIPKLLPFYGDAHFGKALQIFLAVYSSYSWRGSRAAFCQDISEVHLQGEEYLWIQRFLDSPPLTSPPRHRNSQSPNMRSVMLVSYLGGFCISLFLFAAASIHACVGKKGFFRALSGGGGGGGSGRIKGKKGDLVFLKAFLLFLLFAFLRDLFEGGEISFFPGGGGGTHFRVDGSSVRVWLVGWLCWGWDQVTATYFSPFPPLHSTTTLSTKK